MRTKSWRIASFESSSRIRVPVPPPASPVATTGTSRRLSARAMLTPLPPACERLALARWRWSSWRFGTVSVRSSAAFNVTVTIIGRLGYKAGSAWPSRSVEPPADGRRDVLRVPARLRGNRGRRDRLRGHERGRRDQALTVVDANDAVLLAAPDGKRHDHR